MWAYRDGSSIGHKHCGERYNIILVMTNIYLLLIQSLLSVKIQCWTVWRVIQYCVRTEYAPPYWININIFILLTRNSGLLLHISTWLWNVQICEMPDGPTISSKHRNLQPVIVNNIMQSSYVILYISILISNGKYNNYVGFLFYYVHFPFIIVIICTILYLYPPMIHRNQIYKLSNFSKV